MHDKLEFTKNNDGVEFLDFGCFFLFKAVELSVIRPVCECEVSV